MGRVEQARRAVTKRRLTSLVAIGLIAAATACDPEEPEPPTFEHETAIGGLVLPTGVEFAPDGRVFVIEKRGTVQAFNGLDDPSPSLVADLSGNVHNFHDRGLLGLAVDPGFPQRPYLYVLYTLDRDNSWNDDCPDPPGILDDGCVADGRLSRLTVDENNQLVAEEETLLEDMWCIQFRTHTIGDLEFMDDGSLLVSAGEGAADTKLDYGQFGGSPGSPTPANPCGDPPFEVGEPHVLPTAEGGRLRSQALVTESETHTYDGAILRLDPDTGEAHPTNPLVGGGDPAAERIVAHGLRNPYRITPRPGTAEVWVADVGGGLWEEINLIADVEGPVVENFGWPCYEGANQQPQFAALNLDLCNGLYDGTIDSAVTDPYFAYQHGVPLDPEGCEAASPRGAISAINFYDDGAYPSTYEGALFFGDYQRRCIWAMLPDESGQPDPAQIETIVTGTGVRPVDLEMGPDGDMFFVDIAGGTVERISFQHGDVSPIAHLEVSTDNGAVPLEVSFDGTGSTANIAGRLTYEWDLTGDGNFDDSTDPVPTHTYTEAGAVTVSLRVTNDNDLSDSAQVVIHAGNSRPQPVIESPTFDTDWDVGDELILVGSAVDLEDGALPPEALEWQVNIHHCPKAENCHVHEIETIPGTDVASIVAPNHDYPAQLELVLTATDSGGLTNQTSLRLDPRIIDVGFESEPSGMFLGVGSRVVETPETVPMIAGSTQPIAAPEEQFLGGEPYDFVSWSHGGEWVHDVTITEPVTFAAHYVLAESTPGEEPEAQESQTTATDDPGDIGDAGAVVNRDDSGDPEGLVDAGDIGEADDPGDPAEPADDPAPPLTPTSDDPDAPDAHPDVPDPDDGAVDEAVADTIDAALELVLGALTEDDLGILALLEGVDGDDLAAADGPDSLELTDLDGDGVPDVAMAVIADTRIAVVLDDRDAAAENFTLDRFGLVLPDVIAADLNGSGRLDMAVIAYNAIAEYADTVAVLFGQDRGSVGQPGGWPFADPVFYDLEACRSEPCLTSLPATN